METVDKKKIMIDKVLTNLVYLFYPKNVCAYTEKDKYFETTEYKRLKDIIVEFDSEKSKTLRNGIVDLFKEDDTLKGFEDFSLFEWEDRCLTFNLTLILNEELYTISLYISILIPYYVISCQKNIIDVWFSKEQISDLQKNNTETRQINDLVLDIESIVEDKLLYLKFPEEMLNIIIEDVSFQDSYLGEFKIFNAFFNNNILSKIK